MKKRKGYKELSYSISKYHGLELKNWNQVSDKLLVAKSKDQNGKNGLETNVELGEDEPKKGSFI